MTLPAGLKLCRLTDVQRGRALGFDAGVFAVHGPDGPVIYVNSCPHLGVPLDWAPNRFLSADGGFIMCGTHGAEFRLNDGLCLRGPCRDDSLTKVDHRIEAGWIVIDPVMTASPKNVTGDAP